MKLKPGDPASAEAGSRCRPPSPAFRVLYVGLVFLAGVAAVIDAIHVLSLDPGSPTWLILALLTWASGFFALKIPRVPVTISISETFVFMIVLLFGGAPAVLTVAADGLITAIHRRNLAPRRLLFNFAEPAVSVWIAAAAFSWLAGSTWTDGPGQLGRLFVPAMVMAAAYFASNGWLTALAVMSDTGESPLRLWRENFIWLSLNYFGGASIALLLALDTRAVTISSILAVVPLLLLLYVTFKTWIRRIDDATRHLTELNQLYLATVESLSMAIDAKDQVTHGHIRRVQKYALALARAMGIDDEKELRALEAAALLHDMGKVAVPDHILNKPGRLTPAEYERIKLHAVIGADILSAIDFPFPVVPIVRHHHENWDGTGYPDGLKGDEIPIGARILSVIDCYDALTSDRPYRPALPVDEALAIVQERRGTMYDPRVVDAFLALLPRLPAVEDGPESRVDALVRLARPAAPPPDQMPAPAAVANGIGESILRLSALSDALGTHATAEDIVALFGRYLRRLTPAALVVFHRLDAARDVLTVACASGAGEASVLGLRAELGAGLSGWVAAHRTSIRNSNPSLEFGSALAAIEPKLESALSVPLVWDACVVGTLTLCAPGRQAFSQAHQDVVELLAGPLASALRRVQRFEEDQAAALIDEATGLPNDAYLARLLMTRGFSESVLLQSLGVVAIDVSPAPADAQVLPQVAAAVRAAVRVTDLVFRHGESQVVVLLPSCTAATGEAVLGRIAAGLRPVPGVSSVRLGFSRAPNDGDTLTELIQAAQARLRRHRPGTPFVVAQPAPEGERVTSRAIPA
jgi:putative nucleotidyltransferase with HDIG domain